MKVTNELLAQYVEIEQEIKALSDQLEAIKIIIKKAGSVSTKDYVVIVENRERRVGPGIELLIATFGEKAVTPMIKIVGYQTLKVSRKAA